MDPAGMDHADNADAPSAAQEAAEVDDGSTHDGAAMNQFDDMDSGCDTMDPVDRFFKVAEWQRQFSRLRRRTRRERNERNEGSPTKRPLAGAVQQLRCRSKELTSRMREGQGKVVGSLRNAKQQYARQAGQIKRRLDTAMSTARSSKVRQLRHMVCFTSSMLDVVVTAYWLGASPRTHYWYYTGKCVGLISLRAAWYKWHGAHYYLFDLCYFVNLMLMLYLWVVPRLDDLGLGHLVDPQLAFNAMYGFCGVMMLSVPLFRNSFVPHSLDKITSVQIHVSPSLQLWVLRWFGEGGAFVPDPQKLSVLPGILLYLVWLAPYAFYQFVLRRKHIERKGYETLYHLFYEDFGFKTKLPPSLRGPMGSRFAFMLGHMLLFLSGLPAVHFPFALHTLCIIVCIIAAFWGGARFYITYFWKVYDSQIHAFEKQVSAAARAADGEGELDACSSPNDDVGDDDGDDDGAEEPAPGEPAGDDKVD